MASPADRGFSMLKMLEPVPIGHATGKIFSTFRGGCGPGSAPAEARWVFRRSSPYGRYRHGVDVRVGAPSHARPRS
jgi:hypothetical protein